MLLNSVVIVVQEVLEAALLMSVLMAASRLLDQGSRWIALALIAGLAGAIGHSVFLETIAGWFDGVGQEVVNAGLQLALFATLTGCVFSIGWRPRVTSEALRALMAIGVALAITREGSEVLIYVAGFARSGELASSAWAGSLIGAGIGSSVGILAYYLLLSQPRRRALTVIVVLLALIGSGMSIQATQQLIQADWIFVAGPVWDSSGVVAENSIAGQLLYALIGYESTPSATEVIVYCISLAAMVAALALGSRPRHRAGSGVRGRPLDVD